MATITLNPTVDGIIQQRLYTYPQTWAAMRDGVGTYVNTADTPVYLFYLASLSDIAQMGRSAFLFDVDAYAPGTTLTATFSVYGTAKYDVQGILPDINVFGIDPDSISDLLATDYSKCGIVPYCDTPIAYADYNTAGYNDFVLNAAGIAAVLSGDIGFCLRNANYDVADVNPNLTSTNAARMSANLAESETNKPKLVINYTLNPFKTQAHYRAYDDDAGLNASAPLANEDSIVYVNTATNFRIRIETTNTGGASGAIARRLEFQEDNGAWTQITTNSNNVRLATSTNFSDGDATTQRLTPVGTFVAGQGKSTSSDTSSVTLAVGENVEDEWCVKFESGASYHTYQFRVTNAGTALDSYSGTITVQPIASIGLVPYTRHERLSFSTLNDPESWPQLQLDPNNILGYPSNAGGYIDFGRAGARITAVVGEGGESGSTLPTATLLILKRNDNAYRLSGYDWSTFQVSQAGNFDCLSNCAVNIGQGTAWISSKGPVILPGGTQVLPIYQKLFPTASSPFSNELAVNNGADDVWDLARCAYWRDYLLFSYPSGDSTTNDRCYAYHVPSGSWFELGDSVTELDISSLVTYNGPTDNQQLYVGESSGVVTQLFTMDGDHTYFSGTSGVQWKYVTGMIDADSKQSSTIVTRQIEEIGILVKRPPEADTDITVSLHTNGADVLAGTPAYTETVTATAADDGWQWLRCYPTTQAWGFQLELSGTSAYPLTIEEIRVRYKPEAKL